MSAPNWTNDFYIVVIIVFSVTTFQREILLIQFTGLMVEALDVVSSTGNLGIIQIIV